MIMTILSANKLISTDLKKLELSLIERSKTQTEMINQLGNHIISSGGKRLRPVILLLSAYACRDELDDKAIDASVVVEFIHAATLLHDDVVDMSQIRHNQDTANIIWGNKGAVLVGDFLYSRAFEIIVEINNKMIYETLATTTNLIAQGEVMQLMNIGNIDLSEESYLDIIYRKTAILFEASAKIGAIINNSLNEDMLSLSSFGLHFGTAYQLRNDYLDYFGNSESTGKNIIEDLLEGKATLPIIHALRNADEKDRSLIKELFTKADSSVENKIINILKKYNSNDYMQSKIEEKTELAIKSLDGLSESIYKDELVDLALFCKERFS